MCLHVRRNRIEVLPQCHVREAVERNGMNRLAAEGRAGRLPHRSFDRDRKRDPTVDRVRKRSCSIPSRCTGSPLRDKSQDAPPDRKVGPSANGCAKRCDSAIAPPLLDDTASSTGQYCFNRSWTRSK